jgi:hypothetical protein
VVEVEEAPRAAAPSGAGTAPLLALLLHAAAFDAISAFSRGPSAWGGGEGAGGACAGAFLSARIGSDVWPSLRAVLAAGGALAAGGGWAGAGEGAPAPHTLLAALRAVEAFAAPAACVAREAVPSGGVEDAGGAAPGAFGSGLHATVPYGSAGAPVGADGALGGHEGRARGAGGAAATPTRVTRGRPALPSSLTWEAAVLVAALARAPPKGAHHRALATVRAAAERALDALARHCCPHTVALAVKATQRA